MNHLISFSNIWNYIKITLANLVLINSTNLTKTRCMSLNKKLREKIN